MRTIYVFKMALFSIVALLALPKHSISTDELKSADEIVRALDRLYRSDHSYAEMHMEIVNPNWQRTIRMKVWAKGMKKTFIRILSPKKDRGISTLRMDTEMWNYFPKIDKVMKIPPSMMMGSYMGSDFTNDDLVKESTRIDDYKTRLIQPEGGDSDHYHIESVPKERTATVWGKITSVVRKADLVPVKEEYYDEHGEKMRVITFSDVRIIDGKKIPVVIELVPLKKKGNKTVIRYKKIDFSEGGDEKIYSLRNLEKRI